MFLAGVEIGIWQKADCISAASLNVSAYGSQNIFPPVAGKPGVLGWQCRQWDGRACGG